MPLQVFSSTLFWTRVCGCGARFLKAGVFCMGGVVSSVWWRALSSVSGRVVFSWHCESILLWSGPCSAGGLGDSLLIPPVIASLKHAPPWDATGPG